MSFINSLFTTEHGRRTLAYYALITSLGLSIGVSGPTLPALAGQIGSPVGQLGSLFLVGSIGGAFGTFLGGRLFDRMRGHQLLGLAQMAAAAMFFLYPFIPTLWVLLMVAFCKGVADGIINTGTNTLIMWTHQDKAGPFVNALHFAFGLGAFVSPFLVAQVLGIENGYKWAFWGLGIIAFVVGLWMLLTPGDPEPVRHTDLVTDSRPELIPYPFVFATTLFLFFYVGAEITFGGWLYTYAVTLNLADPVNAAYLTSAFWFSFTLGRLLSIPVASRFPPVPVIATSVLGGLIVLAVLIAFPSSSVVMWACAIGIGFCLAPIYATGYNLAGQSLRLTARVSGFILLGDSFGGMILPWLTGLILEASGAGTMTYLVFGSLALHALAFVAMLRLKPRKELSVS